MFTEQHTLFLHATPEERADAMDRVQQYSADYGDTIVTEGEEIRAIAYVLDGSISMFATDYELDEVKVNQVVGEAAIWGEPVALTTLRAVKPVDFLVIDRDDYLALREAGNVVAYNLERISLETLTERIRDMEERLSAMLGTAADDPPENEEPGLLKQLVSFVRKPKADRAAPNVDVLAQLAACPGCADIPETSLAEIARIFRPVAFPEGWWIYAMRQLPERAFLLIDGRVEITMGNGDEIDPKKPRANPVLATLESGALFGVTSLVDEHPRTVNCRALSPVTALAVDVVDFRRLYRQDDTVGSDFRQMLVRSVLANMELVATQLYQLHLDNLRYAQETVKFLYHD